MKTNMTFANAVYELKGDRSIRQMARDTGVAASYITGILKGRYYPTLKILKRITSPKGKPQGNVTILDLINLVDEDELER